MPDPFWVSLFCVTAAIGIVREAFKKDTWYYRLRWLSVSFPFAGLAIGYADIYLSGQVVPPIAQGIVRYDVLLIAVLATGYFLVDFIDDMWGHFKRRKENKQ